MIELKNCGIGVETQSLTHSVESIDSQVETQSLSHSVESIDSQVGQLAGSSDIFLKIDIPSIVVSETMEM
jgi:hypothetical protein